MPEVPIRPAGEGPIIKYTESNIPHIINIDNQTGKFPYIPNIDRLMPNLAKSSFLEATMVAKPS